MKLWLLTQNVNFGWDIYLGCVVAAEDEHTAKSIYPDVEAHQSSIDYRYHPKHRADAEWVDIKDIICEYIGEAKEGTKRGIIIASYKAG